MARSPRLSFKGYKFNEALYRNKDTVKALVLLVTGYSYLTGFQLNQFLIALAGGVIALAGKLILDAFDFYFTEVDL